MRYVLSSKIHKATVTQAELLYIGSISIDQALMERVGLWPGERVLIVSNTTGARLETYTIPVTEPGTICMNGACSHLIGVGEEIIIMGFTLSDRPLKAQSILVDKQNKFVRDLEDGNSELVSFGLGLGQSPTSSPEPPPKESFQ
ncbi:MAG TPA: aspartate 1-decarboxylase [Pyrinomonadaceae bacterium]|jgi:aspartate 1-decarboxylase|nr:aspartate 1-decarboxylase [Pyrinomonadaceae bacterium]